MKNKLTRKAFTIVELVIVIAVIAILAAVLIPTFSSLIQKSKVSADQQLIRNLNTALKADVKAHNTMTEALKAASDYGYDVSKINASATGNEILWDSKNDIFCYLDGSTVKYIPDGNKTLDAADVDLWIIAKAPSNKYSTYLYKTELTVIDDLTTGLDVGNETITAITYKGSSSANYAGNSAAQSVVIRTTGGTLTINAPADTVNHYGEGLVLTIDAIAPLSYHEFGYFPKATIAQGRIVVEDGGEIRILDASVSTAPVVVETKETGVINNVVTGNNANVSVSEDLQNNVVEQTEVSNATELETALANKAQYIVLTNDIATSQISVIDYSVTLDGSGHTLTSSTGVSKSESSKTVNITAANVEVLVVDLKTVENNDYEYGRGIQIEAPGVKLVIENCEVNAMHYAINMFGGTSEEGSNNCNVTIRNSKINGWGALNIWSHNLELEAVNSLFDGYNDKVYNSAGWNGFGTIVLEGDTTRKTTKHAENCKLVFTNCTVVSASTTGNSQSPVLYNLYSKNNVIKFIDCDFSWSRPNLFCQNDGENNNLYIDEKQVLIGKDAFAFDTSDLVIASDGVTATGTIKVTLDTNTVTFDLSTVTGKGWKRNGIIVGTDYIFENINIDGTTYTFDFDISSGYTGGWTLYLSADIDQ